MSRRRPHHEPTLTATDPFTPPGSDPAPSTLVRILTNAARRYVDRLPLLLVLTAVATTPDLLGDEAAFVGHWVIGGLCTAYALVDAHARTLGIRPTRATLLAALPHVPWAALTLLASTVAVLCAWMLVLPGMYLSARWALVWPVVVLEGGGLDAAAERSAGRRWLLLGVVLASGSVVLGPALIVATVIVLVDPALPIAVAGWMLVTLLSWFPTYAAYEAWLEVGAATDALRSAPPQRRAS